MVKKGGGVAKGAVRKKDIAKLKKIHRQVVELLDEADRVLHMNERVYNNSRVWMNRAMSSFVRHLTPGVSPDVTMADTIEQLETESEA